MSFVDNSTKFALGVGQSRFDKSTKRTKTKTYGSNDDCVVWARVASSSFGPVSVLGIVAVA